MSEHRYQNQRNELSKLIDEVKKNTDINNYI